MSGAFVISLALHAILAVLAIPAMVRPPTDRLLELACPMECRSETEDVVAYDMTILREPPPPAELVEPAPEQEEEELTEEEQEEETAAEEPSEPEPLPEHFYMVDLESPTEVEPPEDTNYLAQDNNRAEEEMQAEITALVETDPGQELSAAPDTEPSVPEPEEASPDDTEEIDEQVAEAPMPPEVETAEAEVLEIARAEHETPIDGPDPNLPTTPGRLDLSAFRPSMQSYQQTRVSSDDRQQRERIARQMRYEGYLGSDDRAEWERTRAALENMVPEVRAGTETHLNTRRHEYAEYIAYMHRRIHALWANEYLLSLDLRFDPGDPLSNPNLRVVLEIVLGPDGTIERVNFVSTSGVTMFDVEALNTIYQIAPLRPPPTAMRSDNGNSYIHWSFWRDQRMCGTFGASVHRVR